VRTPNHLDEMIREVVRSVPAGRLVSYGDVAEIVADLGSGCSARRVARTMAEFGDGVPWWRVVQAAGTLAEPVAVRARQLLAAEGVVVDDRRVPLQRVRWQPSPVDLTRIGERLRQ
jgi:methylated-DNA-protein-cysteine methyltransferase related protein